MELRLADYTPVPQPSELPPSPSPLDEMIVATKPVQSFRAFQQARVNELLTTKRCIYPGDAEDVHNFLPGLAELVMRAQPRTVIEIGSDRGVSTELFLLTTARVVAVDPWENHSALQEFAERCACYPHLEIRRGKCPEALANFGVEFDMCYIDADHSYEAVRRDILACTRIVKPDGWLAGHDYHQPQVARAVLSMLVEPLTFRDGSWLAKNRLSRPFLTEQEPLPASDGPLQNAAAK